MQEKEKCGIIKYVKKYFWKGVIYMKKRALDRVYEELETKYKEMPDDEMQESIDSFYE